MAETDAAADAAVNDDVSVPVVKKSPYVLVDNLASVGAAVANDRYDDNEDGDDDGDSEEDTEKEEDEDEPSSSSSSGDDDDDGTADNADKRAMARFQEREARRRDRRRARRDRAAMVTNSRLGLRGPGLEPSPELRAWLRDNHARQMRAALSVLHLADDAETVAIMTRRVQEYRDARDTTFTLLQALCTVSYESTQRAWWASMRHCLFHVLSNGGEAALDASVTDAAAKACAVGKLEPDLLQSPTFVYDLCVAHIQHDNFVRAYTADDVQNLLQHKTPRARVASFMLDPSVQNFKLLVYVSYYAYWKSIFSKSKSGLGAASGSASGSAPTDYQGHAMKLINEKPMYIIYTTYNWPPVHSLHVDVNAAAAAAATPIASVFNQQLCEIISCAKAAAALALNNTLSEYKAGRWRVAPDPRFYDVIYTLSADACPCTKNVYVKDFIYEKYESVITSLVDH
jgi:hypothetical protein